MRRRETTLVLGCTGSIGGRVAERLWDTGHRIRAGSRRADPPFDWRDRAGWDAVLEGVTSLYLTLPAGPDGDGLEKQVADLLEMAAGHGVRRLVFLSRHGETRSGLIERIVRAGPVSWTIFRVGGLVPGAGQPPAEADRVADSIVRVLTRGGFAGRLIDVAGSGPVSLRRAM